MKKIEVVAAVLINKENKIFCAQRKDAGELALKWEFPGGKIEPGESHKEALTREIEEELSTKITLTKFIMTIKHQYKTFHLTMHAYYCKVINGNLTLNEHKNSKWVAKEDLLQLDLAAADIPIVKKIISQMSKG